MRAFSHSGRPWAPGTPLACCRKGRYSVGVPSGGGGTGLSSQRWRTSKVFVPSSNTFKLICLRATALLSSSHFAPYGIARRGGRAVSPIAERHGKARAFPCRVSSYRLQVSGFARDSTLAEDTYSPARPEALAHRTEGMLSRMLSRSMHARNQVPSQA